MMFIPQDSMMFFCLCLSLKLIKFYYFDFIPNRPHGGSKIQTHNRPACVPCDGRAVNGSDLGGAPSFEPTGQVSIEILGLSRLPARKQPGRCTKFCRIMSSLLVGISRRRGLSMVTIVPPILLVVDPGEFPGFPRKNIRYNQYLRI